MSDNKLPISNWTKTAMNSFADMALCIDRIKKHKAIPTKMTDDISELKKILTEVETDIVKRELFRTKMALLLRDVYAMVKDSNLFTKKEKKEFRRGCREFSYSSPNSVAVNHSYTKPKQIGFNQNFGSVSRQRQEEKMTISTPDFRKEFKSNDVLTSVHKGEPKFNGVPDIILTRLAFNKIKVWCESLDDEIQALGIVEQQEGGVFLIKDFFLFDQIVSKTVCEEKSAQALVDLMMEVERCGYNSRDLKVWWHSHNSMGVSPSAQDLRTTEKYGASGFLISLITNHQGQFNSKISFTKPFEFEILDVPVMILDEGMTSDFVKQQQALIRKHVETKRVTYFQSGPSHYEQDFSGYDEHFWGRRSDSIHNKPEPLIDNINNERKVEQETGVRTEKEFDEMFDDAMIVCAVEKGEAPFDNSFQEGDICYTWNVLKRRYDVTTRHGRVLEAKDLEECGAADYNKTIDEAIEAMRAGSSAPTTVEGA